MVACQVDAAVTGYARGTRFRRRSVRLLVRIARADADLCTIAWVPPERVL